MSTHNLLMEFPFFDINGTGSRFGDFLTLQHRTTDPDAVHRLIFRGTAAGWHQEVDATEVQATRLCKVPTNLPTCFETEYVAPLRMPFSFSSCT
ncbi:uncharacterized protein SPSK_06787 [Sporothrix schenckii 1099-18]|uniref:Uncharacterized protein n=1 Tax=Sporothrix schenckii 1099-18 TaxID=1397361 RepID=A0A0F2MJD0_SPOSC|nr:uncharacterized protein SPSK_06787 [Sporothrix schenckii 1099-18]KJR89813.1 hypothetical protein SPSK_06787 [Sporothrix schenckii 1099-18]